MNRDLNEIGPGGVPSELSRPLSWAVILPLAGVGLAELFGLGWLLLQLV